MAAAAAHALDRSWSVLLEAVVETAVWLEISKYGVAPYRGKREIELFADMESLYRHYWGDGPSAV